MNAPFANFALKMICFKNHYYLTIDTNKTNVFIMCLVIKAQLLKHRVMCGVVEESRSMRRALEATKNRGTELSWLP